MNFELPPHLEPFVNQEFSTGRYATREDVIIQAVSLLRDERLHAVEGIQEGIADMHAGRLQPLSDTFKNIRQEFGLNDSK